MDRSSTDLSPSGRDAPVRRRRRHHHGRFRKIFRRRSPTPASRDRTPSPSAASLSQQPHTYYGLPYVVAAPLPVFRGDPGECPDAHLARLDHVCGGVHDAASEAAAARAFPASLDGDAALWYDLVAASGSPPPWHAVRVSFLDSFRPPGDADRARADLMSLRQRPGEGVSRYHLRMLGILRRFPGGGVDVPDELLKAVFVDGLRAEFQEWVVPPQPETLDSAVALALICERAEGVREARRAAKEAGSRCGFCTMEGHDEERCELRRRMREFCLRRSSSGGGGSGRGSAATAAEDDGGGGGMMLARLGSAVSTRSAQCQCRKHGCAKNTAAASEQAGDDADGN